MAVSLLDVNVLVALMWPAHEAHTRALSWFHSNHKAGWASCPFTQTAVIRILSNPAFSKDAITPAQAEEILAANLKHPSHRFWPADIEYRSAISLFASAVVGHRQISDAYLVGLAIHRRGKFATLDQRVRTFLPEGSRLREMLVEI